MAANAAKTVCNPEEKESSSVVCDICVEEKTLALKTCLKCEISMCAQHLQTHLSSPVLLQTHPLTEPASTCQVASRCSAHGKLVEYYCLHDRVLTCMSCAVEEGHRQHNMKTLQNAHMELVNELRAEFKTLAQRQDKAKELDRWYKDQRQTLENSVSRLSETGSALKDLVLTSVQTSVSARLEALETAQQAVSSALKEKDNFIFLQGFASVHKALQEARMVDLRLGLESSTDRIKLVEEIREIEHIFEEQVHNLQQQFLDFVDPEKKHSVPKYKSNSISELTFDPATLGPGMTLSKDHKTVFYNFPATNLYQPSTALHGGRTTSQNVMSQRLKQFEIQDQNQTVCCVQTNQTDILRWFFQLTEHHDWTIGLCNLGATNGIYEEVYGLKKQNTTLTSLQTQRPTIHSDFNTAFNRISYARRHRQQDIQFSLQKQRLEIHSDSLHANSPLKLEVIWDCSAQLLTFYTRNKLTKGSLLCKLQVNSSRYNLIPFFTIENKTSSLQNMRSDQEVNRNSYTEILCVLSNQ